MKPSVRSLSSLFFAVIVSACAPPRDQFVVAIDTDAPAPRLVNRLRLEIMVVGDDGKPRLACEACAREVAIDADTVWPMSFGVPEGLGTPLVVRAQLFPAGRVQGERVNPGTSLERFVMLTERAEVAGLDRRRVHLPFACGGIVADLSASCDATGRRGDVVEAPDDDGSPSRVGSVESEEVTAPCAGAPSSDTGLFDADVCVRGGAFWMGDPRGLGLGPVTDGFPEHPVVVRSFYMDAHEFTIARRREIGDEVLARGCGDESDPSKPFACLTQATAAALCAARGRRLPTEAEREWAAGAGAEERRFPWGDVLVPARPPPEPADCYFIGAESPGHCRDQPAPYPVGSHPLGGTPDGIYDLVGNVDEWTADRYSPYGSGCWEPGVYSLLNPSCPPVGEDDPVVLRGGSWMDGGPYGYPAAARSVYAADVRGAFIGFRCVRDAD